MEVPYGGSTEIPEISANVLLQFSQDVEIYADWEVDDPSIADIEDGMIRGKKVGSTALRMTLFPGHKKEQEVTGQGDSHTAGIDGCGCNYRKGHL